MMEQINLDNYEAYLLDYLENRLNPEDREALRRFLLLHPELEIDLEENLPSLSPEASSFPSKEELHRHVAAEEDLLIAHLEGLLTAEEKAGLEKRLVEEPALKQSYAQYEKTLLRPDLSEHFNFKKALHRTEEDLILNNPILHFMEGSLSKTEEAEFQGRLKTEENLALLYRSYLKTKLQAEAIVHPNKAALYRKTKVIGLSTARPYFAAAAAIALLLALLPLLRSWQPERSKASSPVLAHKESTLPAKNQAPEPAPKQWHHPLSQKPFSAVAKNNYRVPASQKDQKPVEQGLAMEADTSLQKADAMNEESKELLASNTPSNQASAPLEEYSKLDFAHMIPFEEDEDEAETDEENNSKRQNGKGFWKKATRLAKQVNKLGFKSVDGNETNERYLISFHAMSIEKR